MFVRPLLGKKSDAIGRGPAIAIGLGAQLIGLVALVTANDITIVLAGGFFTTIGMSMIGSTTTALALDLANPRSRGRAMATFSISYQLGAGLGSLISGALADTVGLRGMYVGSVVITVAGLGLLASAWKLLPRPAASSIRNGRRKTTTRDNAGSNTRGVRIGFSRVIAAIAAALCCVPLAWSQAKPSAVQTCDSAISSSKAVRRSAASA